MEFKLNMDGKLAISNTLAGIVGGILSFYSDRGALNLGTPVSILIGLTIMALAAYVNQKIFNGNNFKWFLNQGAMVYILTWLVVNGVLTTV